MIPLFKVRMAKEAPDRVREVLESGYIGQGPVVEKFETVLEGKFGRRPLTVSSCTHGLDLAYHLAGIKRGSYVISTPMTCLATNLPLVNREARIVWADIDPLTGNIDPASVEKLLDKHGSAVEAIVIVDWGGRECDNERIAALAERRHTPVIEDAAHVFHRKPGGYPDNWYTAYSFQAIKHLTTGDGGALIVPPEQYERAKLLRWFGLDRTKGDAFRCAQNVKEAGYKYHMNDIAASIGLANFSLGEDSVYSANSHAMTYNDRLKKCRIVKLPPPDTSCSWWLYTIRVPKRDDFIKFMAEKGVMVGPAHRRNDKNECTIKRGDVLPGVSEYDPEQCSIPVGWWLTIEDQDRIINAVLEWDEDAVRS